MDYYIEDKQVGWEEFLTALNTRNYECVESDGRETLVYTGARRISELKKALFETDYQAIKYAEGLISVEEYASIKAQRQMWRDEINELENIRPDGV